MNQRDQHAGKLWMDLNITLGRSSYTLIEYKINGLETIIDIWINEVFIFGF